MPWLSKIFTYVCIQFSSKQILSTMFFSQAYFCSPWDHKFLACVTRIQTVNGKLSMPAQFVVHQLLEECLLTTCDFCKPAEEAKPSSSATVVPKADEESEDDWPVPPPPLEPFFHIANIVPLAITLMEGSIWNASSQSMSTTGGLTPRSASLVLTLTGKKLKKGDGLLTAGDGEEIEQFFSQTLGTCQLGIHTLYRNICVLTTASLMTSDVFVSA